MAINMYMYMIQNGWKILTRAWKLMCYLVVHPFGVHSLHSGTSLHSRDMKHCDCSVMEQARCCGITGVHKEDGPILLAAVHIC